jgi:hypothetical protein
VAGSAALDTGDTTVYAIRAVTPNAAGTFVTLDLTVGSNAAVGTTTYIVLGLYSDAGGVPGNLLFYSDSGATTSQFANPAALFDFQSSGGFYQTGFTGALTANTTYWVYLKGYYDNEGNAPDAIITGLSSSPCQAGEWLNVAAPGMWSFTQGGQALTCPGNIGASIIETFP